jgi:hypothetical protein
MARKIQLEYSAVCYHVIKRGNYRRTNKVPLAAALEATLAFTRVAAAVSCARSEFQSGAPQQRQCG